MRKATWGILLLGLFAFTFGSPIRDVLPLHRILSLSGLAAYLLLSFDPPKPDPRQRKFLLAGMLTAVASFLIAFAPFPEPVNVIARVLAVATVALPLWLVAGPARYGFVAAGALALSSGIPFVDASGPYATSVHAYVAGASALLVAALLHKPSLLHAEKKKPRVVVSSNIVTLSPDDKAKALARLEKRFRNGELEEHVYLDKKQELESR